jgi:N-methylhydantoinase A
MVRALRVISVQRGLDPRDFALVAFGGAGGLHACALAEELGCRTVLVPRAAGVLSAFGLAISEVRHDYLRPALGDGRSVDEPDLEAGFTALEAAAGADLMSPATQRLADLRYAGQSFELTVPGSAIAELQRAFHAEHERRYGYRIDDEPVEIVNLRLAATVPGVRPDLREQEPQGSAVGRRRVLTEDGAVDAAVLNRALMGAGSTVQGPAVVEFAEATCLVRPGWSGVIDHVGTLVLTREPAVGEVVA